MFVTTAILMLPMREEPASIKKSKLFKKSNHKGSNILENAKIGHGHHWDKGIVKGF